MGTTGGWFSKRSFARDGLQRQARLRGQPGLCLRLWVASCVDRVGAMKRELRELNDWLDAGKRLREPLACVAGEGGANEGAATVAMAERLLRIRNREGVEVPLIANAVQRRFEAGRARQNIVLKARQMGMTTWVAGQMFLKTITEQGVLTVLVAHTREAGEGIFQIVQRFWECLPEEARESCLRRSIANSGRMYFPALGSEFRVVSAADENAGRGLTIQNLHCSEVSRWPGDAGATLAGLRAALVPEGELVLESTANGAYGCFYEEWMRAGEGADGDGVVRHFFPWWLEESYRSAEAREFTAEEERLMAVQGLSAGQIGFRRGLEASFRGMRSQEFAEDAETCFRATGSCLFDVEAIETRMAELLAPVETRWGGALQIWLPKVPDKEYLVAVDTAGGGADGDFAAVEVIEIGTGLQCAELQQRIGGLELARAAAGLAREYGGALIVVERNNHGAGVLAYLDAVERYARVYAQDGTPGWLTTVGSKPGMVSRMGAFLAESPWMFLSRRLLAECRTFVSFMGGKTGAANGAHDDCFMAMAMAQAVRVELLLKKE